MTAAHDYEDLHRLVDRLTPDQARELRTHALVLMGDPERLPSLTEETVVPRDLSFIGLIHAEPDLAQRSQEILREELGH